VEEGWHSYTWRADGITVVVDFTLSGAIKEKSWEEDQEPDVLTRLHRLLPW
jgi:hypothetical protein